MAMDVTSYVLSKRFTSDTADSLGAVKGAPATIKSITEVEGGQKVTFEWTGTSGTKQTSEMIVKNGVSVTGISDKGNGVFTLLLSDGSETDPIQTVKGQKGDKGDKLTFNDLSDTEKESLKGADGQPGADGADGVSPIITENINNTDDIYRLDITTDTGTIITPNLKGSGSGGSEVFDRTDLTAVTVGGLNSGSSVKNKTTKEVLESILFPYQKPTVSFSISPNTTVYESGTAVSSIKFTISATKKSDIIQFIKVYDGSTLLTTITSGVASGGTFTYTYSCNITSNTTLKVEVSDGTSTVSATKNITFVSPYYYGVSSNDLNSITSADILSMTKDVTAKGNKNYKFTCNNEYCVFIYPKSYGLLSSILDSNNFENLYSWENGEIIIDSTSYYVYETNIKVTCDNFAYRFIY